MEGLVTLTGIVMIAFGILQIILFFKVWGMTNNVKRIWDKIDNEDFLSEACYTYLKGDIESTEQLLNDAFIKEISLLSKSSETYGEWDEGYAKLVSKYTRAFNKIGKPIPNFEKYNDSKIYLL